MGTGHIWEHSLSFPALNRPCAPIDRTADEGLCHYHSSQALGRRLDGTPRPSPCAELRGPAASASLPLPCPWCVHGVPCWVVRAQRREARSRNDGPDVKRQSSSPALETRSSWKDDSGKWCRARGLSKFDDRDGLTLCAALLLISCRVGALDKHDQHDQHDRQKVVRRGTVERRR